MVYFWLYTSLMHGSHRDLSRNQNHLKVAQAVYTGKTGDKGLGDHVQLLKTPSPDGMDAIL